MSFLTRIIASAQIILLSTVDSMRDQETYEALRLTDLKDVASYLLTQDWRNQQASRRDRHSIRAVSASDSKYDFLKKIEDLRREIPSLKSVKMTEKEKFNAENLVKVGIFEEIARYLKTVEIMFYCKRKTNMWLSRGEKMS